MQELTVFDLAEHILRRTGAITVMKLQKLVYYCQAWAMVWDEKKIFPERLEAWAHGPVCPDLFHKHKGNWKVGEGFFKKDPVALPSDLEETVISVVEHYGRFSAQQLSDLTHREDPWRLARIGLDAGERGQKPISDESIVEYYSSLAVN